MRREGTELVEWTFIIIFSCAQMAIPRLETNWTLAGQFNNNISGNNNSSAAAGPAPAHHLAAHAAAN